jgi:hypothetical protein
VHHHVGIAGLRLEVITGYRGGAARPNLYLDLRLHDPGLVEGIGRGTYEQIGGATGRGVMIHVDYFIGFRIGGLGLGSNDPGDGQQGKNDNDRKKQTFLSHDNLLFFLMKGICRPSVRMIL